MRKCWTTHPGDRPTFRVLRQWIEEMLERAHHQLGDTDKNANISSVYVNLTLGRECIYENQEFFHH